MSRDKKTYPISPLCNTIVLGDSEILLNDLPSASVDLIVTSPPYYNAKPVYGKYDNYESYLAAMRKIIRLCQRVLAEGRFFVINSSPIIIKRRRRSESSRRIGIPFDLHRICIEEGFDFIDDIVWVKPEGAGCGRGRGFAVNRKPLQYKTIPITEYIMVYRNRTEQLIDWHLHHHPAVHQSNIPDSYEKTNVWRMNPVSHSRHPAAFPFELAEKIIRYYSFRGDVVLDPFAGSGTVGSAASALGRRFVLFEKQPEYIKLICESTKYWSAIESKNIRFLNCEHFYCHEKKLWETDHGGKKGY